VKTIIQVALIALLVRTFVLEPFYVPSKSMLPTLLVGDFLVVIKSSYGFSRHSLPFGLPLFHGRLLFHAPKRGDVVVFRQPSDDKTILVKRVIGLPGDRIQVQHRVLLINHEAVKRQHVEDYADRDPRTGTQRHLQYIETLPNGRAHIIIEAIGPEQAADNTDEFIVPAGHYFMMGDSRDNSQDSRFAEVGYVPEENLVGRAEFVFISSEQSGAPWQFWRWPANLRWSRFFDRIV
jgi:signal peptidase I